MYNVRTTAGTISVIITDTIITVLVFRLFMEFMPGIPKYPEMFPIPLECIIYLLITLVIILSLFIMNLYSPVDAVNLTDLIIRIIPSFFLSFFAVATISFFLNPILQMNWRILPPIIAIFIIIGLFRFIIFYCIRSNRDRILILGAARQAREIIEISAAKPCKGYEIIAAMTFEESRADETISGVPVILFQDDLMEPLNRYAIDCIVITVRDRRGKLPLTDLLNCKMNNIRVVEGFTFYEKVKRKIIIDEFLKPSWFIFEGGFFNTSFHQSFKRAQSLVVSFLLLTLLSPLLLLVAALIKIESKGPVFYVQERIGKNGKIFRLIKFRSMVEDAEKHGVKFAEKDDPRITHVGKIIRKTRIDEVPQFINIFKGNMNLVGPRPERPVFVKELCEVVPYYNLRHAVRPGLTGWAQINYPYGENFKDSREKLKYDLFYIKHCSWHLDLFIMISTIRIVLFGRGQ